MKTRFLPPLMLLLLIYSCTTATLKSQTKWLPWVNTGYITNMKKSVHSDRPDTGGSLRVGMLNRGLFGSGRLGLYTGIIWFEEHNLPTVEYNDKGTSLVAGIDYVLISKKNFRGYIKAGIGPEFFRSEYPTITETDISIKPDLGLFLNFSWVNMYFGWQPSDPSHINIGVGLTLYKKPEIADFEY